MSVYLYVPWWLTFILTFISFLAYLPQSVSQWFAWMNYCNTLLHTGLLCFIATLGMDVSRKSEPTQNGWVGVNSGYGIFVSWWLNVLTAYTQCYEKFASTVCSALSHWNQRTISQLLLGRLEWAWNFGLHCTEKRHTVNDYSNKKGWLHIWFVEASLLITDIIWPVPFCVLYVTLFFMSSWSCKFWTVHSCF